MKVLIKAMRPHRQKVLTEDGEEMRLQQWANKAASSALRGAGGDASGEQFTQARDALMREAVANPDEHGLKFMGERLPFDGQELEESLSEPTFDNDIADIVDASSAETERAMGGKTPDIFDEQGKLRQTLPQGGKMNENDMHDEALADWEARQSDIDFSREQGHTDGYEGKPYHDMEQEELDADKKRFYGMYPHLKPQEEGGFDPDKEAEHMKRIMTSRQVPMRDALSLLKNEPYDWQGQEYDTHCPKCQKGIYRQDEDDLFMIQNAGMCTDCMMPKKAMTSRQVPMRDAWSVLKNDFFNPPEVPCAKCGRPTEPMMYYGSNQMGPQHNTLCEKCEDIPMMEDQ